MNIQTLSLCLFLLSGLYTNCQEPIIDPVSPVVGQQFKVKLPTARATPYNWYFKDIAKQISPAGLIVPKEPKWAKLYGDPTYTVNQEGTSLKNETKIFTFQALKPGTVVLLFEKKHRYKTSKKVIESKEIKVTIKEQ